MENTNNVLGNRLKELCQEKNISYRELGEKIGMSGTRIARIANGMTSNPSVYTMIQICDGLGVSLDEFFGTDEFKELRK